MKNQEMLHKAWAAKQEMIALKAKRKAIKYEIHKEELMKKKESLESELKGVNQALGVPAIESEEDVKGF